MNEDVDAPITDIAFLTSTESCPPGYRVIEQCPCGHSAQLWENIMGDKEAERYIAYTKEYQDGMVVEDIVINDNSMRYLRPGYVVLKQTHDGASTRLLRHRDVIVKKVKRSEAEHAVMDITLYRKSDKPSRLYKNIGKSNGISVCTRVAPLAAKYRNMSGATASASNSESERQTQDLVDGLAQLTMRPQPDARTRAFTAPALDQYVIPAPGYPTPPGMGAGASPTPLPCPYSPPPPVYPSYPTVGFNTSASDLPPPYPMYPPPSNQTGYSQGYPPQLAYPAAPPPRGPFPTTTEPPSARASWHGFPPHTSPTYGFNL